MKNKLKKVVVYILTSLVLVFSVVTPTMAYSSNWSFCLKHRIVDGSKNGQFHKLQKGTVYIAGRYESERQEKNDGNGHNNLYVELWKSRFGFDKSYGSINFGKVGADEFDKKLAKITESDNDYYLVFYKAEQDFWTTKGEGTLHN